MFQIKEQDKIPKKLVKFLSEKEFRVVIAKIIRELGRRMNE